MGIRMFTLGCTMVVTGCGSPSASPPVIDGSEADAAEADAAGREDCALRGDEDDNGRADCGDPVCAGEAACQASLTYVKASNTGQSDHFGQSIAISADGSTLVIGAIDEDGSVAGIDGDQRDEQARSSGAVYVYVRRGSTWVHQAYIKASHPGVDDQFGSAVALSADGSTLAVGASGEASSNGDELDDQAQFAGAVYVFTRGDAGWSQEAYLKASPPTEFERFGTSIALAGDGRTLAVGVPFEDAVGTSSGAVHVFTRAGATWFPQPRIAAAGTEVGDQFGTSVALSANGAVLAVGALGEDSAARGVDGDEGGNTARDAGAVYVFARGAAWAQAAYVKASNASAGDQFGTSVALSADGARLAVGAPWEGVRTLQPMDQPFAGAAYVFARSGPTWSEEAYVKASPFGAFDKFGEVVALSGDGSTLAVAARDEDSAVVGFNGDPRDDTVPGAGAAYAFTRSAQTWRQFVYVKPLSNDELDWFGSSLALSSDGRTLAVGTPNEDSSATGIGGEPRNDRLDAGAAYVATLPLP